MATTKWILDPTHSDLGFKIKHLMITNVSGSFDKFNVQLDTDSDDFKNATIEVSAEINSVNTGNEQRDGHLLAPDFFDAEKFPQMKFKANNTEKLNADGNYTLNGDLTIRDVTKPVSLNVEFGGIANDHYGNTKAGFTVSGKINRKDFGLEWNSTMETGGLLLSEEVKLHAEIQLVKQK
jgi:polyisoprenoid-binding protein YceI